MRRQDSGSPRGRSRHRRALPLARRKGAGDARGRSPRGASAAQGGLMATRVFFLNTLRQGVDPRDYERFVREVDYPFAARLETIRSYVVTRLDGLFEGGDPP